MGLAAGALALVVGSVIGGMANKRRLAARKGRAQEAAVNAAAQAALAQAAADRAAREAAAAKRREARAKLTAREYADFLTSLEASTPGQGQIDGAVVFEYVPPENAGELKRGPSP